jgi:ABC-2 type transport system permease protein
MFSKTANIYRLGIKEIRGLLHDKVLFFFIVWAFSIGIYTAATAASRELHNAPIAIIDEDRSALASNIINAFYKPYFNTPKIISLDEADPGLDSGIYTFVLDIPTNFQRDVQAGKSPDIQLNIDATRMTQAFIGSSYIQNIINRELAEFSRSASSSSALPISLVTQIKYNPNLTGTWFGSVMELINNITMLSIILTGAALIREREHGTLEHLLVMPLSAAEIMLAKVWSMGLVVLVAAGFSLYFIIQGLLNVPILGSVPLFLIGAFLHLFATTSLGIFLGTIARNMPQLGLLMILVILPLQMLSGGVTPRESMPDIVQNIMLVAPTTHFVSLSQAILYRGAGFDVVWPQFIAIISIGCLFFLLALSLFRKSLAASQ